jgi:hypothetical protein
MKTNKSETTDSVISKTTEYNFINCDEPLNLTYYWEEGGFDTKENFDRNKKD